MSRHEIIRFLILRTLGNFLVLVALYGVSATFGPALMYETQFQLIALRGIHFSIEQPVLNISKVSAMSITNASFSAESASSRENEKQRQAPSFTDILAGNKEQILTPIDPLFSILIPKLGIDEQVIPNVDPNNPNEYLPVLQHAVAHAKGSVFPGDQGVTYLFAHSTDTWWDVGRYNAIFYILNNVTIGDEIVIIFENRRHTYVVSEKLISDPQDITYLTAAQSGPQKLVLQTCWPPGTAWKRLYIVANPKGS